MKKIVVLLILLAFSVSFVNAEINITTRSSLEATTKVSSEAVYKPNFWTEFDITFWQTMPFAAFWGCVIDRNIVNAFVVSSNARWQYILPAAVLISVGNAYFHANKVMTPLVVKSGG
jgi:hypothetical protein